MWQENGKIVRTWVAVVIAASLGIVAIVGVPWDESTTTAESVSEPTTADSVSEPETPDAVPAQPDTPEAAPAKPDTPDSVSEAEPLDGTVARPVVSVVNPTGTVTDTNLPTVSWDTWLDPDGGPQSHYEVKIFDEAQYTAFGVSPGASTPTDGSGGIVASSTASSWSGHVALLEDTYNAYVRVGQTVNGAIHWSPWGWSNFVVNVN
jgi:hypothetical protein